MKEEEEGYVSYEDYEPYQYDFYVCSKKVRDSEVVRYLTYKYDYETGEYIQVSSSEWFRRRPRRKKKGNRK